MVQHHDIEQSPKNRVVSKRQEKENAFKSTDNKQSFVTLKRYLCVHVYICIGYLWKDMEETDKNDCF